MARHRIICSQKSSKNEPHLLIERIGGANSDGSLWRITQERAIQGIESGRWTFYVLDGNEPVDIEIAFHNGIKYLKSKRDSVNPESLLKIVDCL